MLKEKGETLNDNDLRRTFASWMLQNGATVKEAPTSWATARP